MLTGPNKELDMKAYQEQISYDTYGSASVIKEFYVKDSMYCLVMVKSGILKMNNCILSLDGLSRETHRKVPCIVAMPNSSIEIFFCNFKGDTLNDAMTAGILAMKSDTTVHESSFAHFSAGAIMVDMKPENNVVLSENIIMSCLTAGIFIQGIASRPQIQGNKIRFSKCSAIITALDVDAYIVQNEIQICGVGIEIQDNKSKIFDNQITKSHEYGIQIVGTDNRTRSMPLVWRNKIE
jgi:molybdenum cofactor biosynthesis enzyme